MEIYSTNEAARLTQADLGCDIVISTWQPPAPNAGDVARIMTHWHTAPEGDTDEERAAFEAARNAVAAARAASYLDAAGKLARSYDPEAADHLRIYGVPGCPPELIGRYFAHRPPTEFPWDTLDPTKVYAIDLVPPEGGVPGDIPEKRYLVDGVAISRRVFAFAYGADQWSATELALTVTPGWARNDGSWVDGPPRTRLVRGEQYNAWRDECRKRIFALLKTHVPRVLAVLEVVADVPAGEDLLRAWLAANHADQWNYYIATGGKGPILASLAADETTWLAATVPAGVVPGVSGGTVREMIEGSLR